MELESSAATRRRKNGEENKMNPVSWERYLCWHQDQNQSDGTTCGEDGWKQSVGSDIVEKKGMRLGEELGNR